MVDLLGHYSNPGADSPLARVAAELRRLKQTAPPKRPVPAPRQRRRPGQITAVLHTVLAEAGRPLRVCEAHAAVEANLAEPVSRSTIKNALASTHHGDRPRFLRVARGRYVIAS